MNRTPLTLIARPAAPSLMIHSLLGLLVNWVFHLGLFSSFSALYRCCCCCGCCLHLPLYATSCLNIGLDCTCCHHAVPWVATHYDSIHTRLDASSPHGSWAWMELIKYSLTLAREEGATQGHAIAGHLLDYMRCVTAQHHQQTSHKGASTCADLVYIYGMTCSFFSYSLADLTAQHHPMSLTSTYPEREEGYISPYFSCALSHLYLPTLIYQ